MHLYACKEEGRVKNGKEYHRADALTDTFLAYPSAMIFLNSLRKDL